MYHEIMIWKDGKWTLDKAGEISRTYAMQLLNEAAQTHHAQLFCGRRIGRLIAEKSPTGEPPKDGRFPGTWPVTKATPMTTV